ncbi:TadE/TadG family type IV pilus assembly protein [Methylobacterium planeticum]|uniref:Pilus assembly protein n=1 Tax=Methylobacterium planeticum TaxID=2615211 RepID=A0A6N6MQX7_9HYPH|nr:TadE/TadG family type IV pilus assembly protein [Methylobacterium planeticum]KAB1070928.1 pilus assembly protein [Methylobacterium planeticum]
MVASVPGRRAGVTEAGERPRARRGAFLHDAGGAAAVEFALVCLPFFGLVAAILQICLIMWATQNLEERLQRAVRTIYTGTFQGANANPPDSTTVLNSLRTTMCGATTSRIPTAFDCSAIKLNVVLSNSFAAGTAPTPLDPKTKDWATGFGSTYSCAKPGAIVVVTAAVKYPVAFGFLNFGAPTFTDGARLLQSTAVFRTEPYDTSSGSPC